MRSVFSIIIGCLMCVACSEETTTEATVTVGPGEVTEAPLPETATEVVPTVDTAVAVQTGDTPTVE